MWPSGKIDTFAGHMTCIKSETRQARMEYSRSLITQTCISASAHHTPAQMSATSSCRPPNSSISLARSVRLSTTKCFAQSTTSTKSEINTTNTNSISTSSSPATKSIVKQRQSSAVTTSSCQLKHHGLKHRTM